MKEFKNLLPEHLKSQMMDYQIESNNINKSLEIQVESNSNLLEPFLPQSGLVMLSGSIGIGKRALLRQLSKAVSLGKDKVLGFQLNQRHQSAFYLNIEKEDITTAYQLHKKRMSDLDFTEYKKLRFNFDTFRIFKAVDIELIYPLVDLVIIDAISNTYWEDLNLRIEFQNFLKSMQITAEENNCLFVFLRDTYKNKQYSSLLPDNAFTALGTVDLMKRLLILSRDKSNTAIRHLNVIDTNSDDCNKQSNYILKIEKDRFINAHDQVELIEPFTELDTEKEAAFLKALELSRSGLSFSEIEIALEKLGVKYMTSTYFNWYKKGLFEDE